MTTAAAAAPPIVTPLTRPRRSRAGPALLPALGQAVGNLQELLDYLGYRKYQGGHFDRGHSWYLHLFIPLGCQAGYALPPRPESVQSLTYSNHTPRGRGFLRRGRRLSSKARATAGAALASVMRASTCCVFMAPLYLPAGA